METLSTSPAMALSPQTYAALDALSTVLTLAVAIGFLAIARFTRQGLHVIIAAGFGLLGLGFLFVSASHFSAGPQLQAGEAARIIGLLAGSLTLLLAYTTVHGERGRPPVLAILLGAVGGTLTLGAALWFLPPVGRLALSPHSLSVAYATVTLAFLGCAILAGYGWHKRPTWGRALVPLGFLCWAFSSYTWIFIDIGGDSRFLVLAYTWRFAALALVLWAMARRPRVAATRGLSDEAA